MDAISLLLTSINSVICLVTISLSTLGIYLLSATKPLKNSRLFLINLASSAIVNSVAQITATHSIRHNPDEDTHLAIRKICAIGGNLCYFAIFLLTADRLIATINPFQHRIYVTKKRLKRLILATWALDLILGASFFLSTVWFVFFDKHVWIPYDVLFVILCSITYGLIFFKIRSRRWFNNDKKFLKITSLIILSFLIFILIPNVMYYHFYAFEHELVIQFLFMAWLAGMMTDPIIYIFLQPELRALLKSKFCGRNIEDASVVEETAL